MKIRRHLWSAVFLSPLLAGADPVMKIPAYSLVDSLMCELDGTAVAPAAPVEERLSGRQVCWSVDGEVLERYYEDGVLLEEQLAKEGKRQRSTMWYMNGKMRTQTQYRDSPRGIIWQIESFRDDGSLVSKAQLTESYDMVGIQQHFDASGRIEREEVYSDSGIKMVERAYDANGQVARETAFFADGSRKQP